MPLLEQTRVALLQELALAKQWLAEQQEFHLNYFENKLTVAELENCLRLSVEEEIEQQLTELLSKRWDRIRNSSMSYTQSPFNPVNRFCLEIAKTLFSLPDDVDAINELQERKGPYCLLMPSLMKTFDGYHNNIHLLPLHEFVLSDDERLFIPLKDFLEKAAESDESEFIHVVSEGELATDYLLLSPTEKERLAHHSESLAAYMKAISDYHFSKKNMHSLAGQLEILKNALFAGGARQGGMEMNAGQAATEGIFAFSQYWETIPLERQESYYQQHPTLRDVLGRLLRPADANYQQVQYCVELIASDIGPLIRRINLQEDNNIQELKELVEQRKTAFEQALSSPNTYRMLPSQHKMAKVIPQLWQLSAQEQEEIFRESGSLNAWIYALEHEPQCISEFQDVSDEMKQQAVNNRFQGNLNPLMIAIKADAYDTIRLLLDWEEIFGNDVIMQDEDQGKTLLHWAVQEGKAEAVALLLERGAPIDFRNHAANNVLDIAIVCQPQLVETLLMKAATLDAFTQQEILQEVIQSECQPNVLAYVLHEKLELWEKFRQNPHCPMPDDLRVLTEATLRKIFNIKSHFDAQLEDLLAKVRELNDRGELEAAQAASQLHSNLSSAGNQYFNQPTADNFHIFKRDCNDAMVQARSILETSRGFGCKKIFGNIALLLMGCGVLYLMAVAVNKVVTGQFLFFQETDSVKKMNTIHNTIKDLEAGINPVPPILH